MPGSFRIWAAAGVLRCIDHDEHGMEKFMHGMLKTANLFVNIMALNFRRMMFYFLLAAVFFNVATAYQSSAEENDFFKVRGPCNFTFPRDHGSHPGYRTEWWYYTGNLKKVS